MCTLLDLRPSFFSPRPRCGTRTASPLGLFNRRKRRPCSQDSSCGRFFVSPVFGTAGFPAPRGGILLITCHLPLLAAAFLGGLDFNPLAVMVLGTPRVASFYLACVRRFPTWGGESLLHFSRNSATFVLIYQYATPAHSDGVTPLEGAPGVDKSSPFALVARLAKGKVGTPAVVA